MDTFTVRYTVLQCYRSPLLYVGDGCSASEPLCTKFPHLHESLPVLVKPADGNPLCMDIHRVHLRN